MLVGVPEKGVIGKEERVGDGVEDDVGPTDSSGGL